MIAKNSGVPYYLQIKQDLSERIRAGLYSEGEYLPSENKLCEQYDVSRPTVRQAVRSLAEMGLVVTEKGRGIRVVSRAFPSSLVASLSFSSYMRSQGLEPSSKLMYFGKHKPTGSAKAALQLAPREETIWLERLRLADGVPLVVELSQLPAKRFGSLMERELGEASLYDILENEFGVYVASATSRVAAGVATPEEAALLQIPVGAPLLLSWFTAYDQNSTPIEFGKSKYRGDHISLVLNDNFGCIAPMSLTLSTKVDAKTSS